MAAPPAGLGGFQQTTLLVGHGSGVAALDEQMEQEAHHGYRVVGCCLPADGRTCRADAFNGSPVLSGLHDAAQVVEAYGVDTVAVLPCPELDGPEVRRLGWALQDTDA